MKLYPTISVLFLLLFGNAASAQYLMHTSDPIIIMGDYQNELSVSDGYLTGRQIANELRNDHDSYNTLTARTGNFFITYRYIFNSKYSLGATLGTESLHYFYQDEYTRQAYNYSQSVVTFAIEFKGLYRFPIVDWFECYYLIGLGVSHFDEKDYSYNGQPIPTGVDYTPLNGLGFNSQFTPLGLRFGKRLGGFIEFGIGYKGIVNGGLSYRFSKT